MEQRSMTALMCAYIRAYHAKNHSVCVFRDPLAERLLSAEEYEGISGHLAHGIRFFEPDFAGSREAALRRIVDGELAPSPLARAAYAEEVLENECRLGARQVLLPGAGYDTFAFRQPDWARGLEIFELDHPATADDRCRRLARAGIEYPANAHLLRTELAGDAWTAALAEAGFDPAKRTVCAMLGLVYYLDKPAFARMLGSLGAILADGSALVFDYPDEDARQDAESASGRRIRLAEGAGETMAAEYGYAEMERLLEGAGFRIYEHLTPPEIEKRFFAAYNRENPGHPMCAPPHVRFCLAVRKRI
ncbi:MAG: class I SAM-dependent methyltransferase [Eubacteriales bacterium]|nr:class I SAM-dependent methyltransferase [Eubacteriales bacterium]